MVELYELVMLSLVRMARLESTRNVRVARVEPGWHVPNTWVAATLHPDHGRSLSPSPVIQSLSGV